MATGGVTVVTGDKELDAKLKALENKVRNKAVSTALRNTIKKVRTDAERLTPVDTGAMRSAYIVRAKKWSKSAKKQARAQFGLGAGQNLRGMEVTVTRKSLAKAMKKSQPREDKKAGKEVKDKGFYPAFVELGTSTTVGQRPMRAALYGNEEAVRAEFVAQIRGVINSL